jgi:hypothetical protein
LWSALAVCREEIVSAERSCARRRDRITSVARVKAPPHRRFIWISAPLLLLGGALAAGGTEQGKHILASVQRFLLFYSGVFALVALTAAVGAGVVATDRIIMIPGTRVVAQAVHRAVSFAALAFLAIHIVLEILARRSLVIEALVPYLVRGRAFYVGLGTVASVVVVVVVATGIARGRFAARWPSAWRAIHAAAYLAWPMSIVHGLLAGRAARPYVDWSYGACVAVVGLALLIRLAGVTRGGKQTAAHPVPHHGSSQLHAAAPAMLPERLPGPGAAGPRGRRAPRALPPATSGQPHSRVSRHAARVPPDPHPDQRCHPSGLWQYRPPAPTAYPSRPGREGS